MKSLTKRVKYGALSLAMLSMTMLYGFNCSRSFVVEDFKSNSTGDEGVQSQLDSSKPDFGVSLLTAEQILKTMISVSGIETATDPENPLDRNITNMFSERSGAFPSNRDIDGITGPMMVAVVNLAGTVCDKVVAMEMAKTPASERRFFSAIDFSSTAAVSSDQLNDVSARMARAFWSREIKPDEQSSISNELLGSVSGVPGFSGTEKRNLAVAVCASMISSVDALVY